MIGKLVGAAALAATLAACGTGSSERTTGGAAAGAATGAGFGALAGPVGALAGAAIGGGAGAITGATTSPSDLNLGEPPWSNPEARVAGTNIGDGGQTAGRSGSGRSGGSVREAQRELQNRGYDVGAVDGAWGPRTASAMREFQRANNLQPTGRLNAETRQALNLSGTGTAVSERDRAYMGGGMVGPATGTTTSPGPAASGGTGRTGASGAGNTGSPARVGAPNAPAAGTGPAASGGTGSVGGTGASGVGNVGSTAGAGTSTAPAPGTGPATTGTGTTTPSGSSAPSAPVR